MTKRSGRKVLQVFGIKRTTPKQQVFGIKRTTPKQQVFGIKRTTPKQQVFGIKRTGRPGQSPPASKSAPPTARIQT